MIASDFSGLSVLKNNGFMIASPRSGSGKTTVSLAIMAALVRRGLIVAPFKCGPDFIDPGYHRLVTGNASINLDGWICPDDFVNLTFLISQISPISPKIAVIEAAMGLFDGIGASSSEGSSARIAKITGAPVVLVVDASGMAASAAALVKGFALFDPQVRVVGVIFNNVGSDSHSLMLKETIYTYCPETRCFGCIPRDGSLIIPSRHLGLVTAEDNPLSDEFIGRLADMAERCLDMEGLIQLQIAPDPPLEKWGVRFPPLFKGVPGGISGVKIAVARDSAFCFIYEDNLRLLRDAGAEITFFSPLNDHALPTDISGIYLPGGYPELYARQLSANIGMIDSIRASVAANMPVYAECGGFVYLTEGVDASENQPEADLVGIFPVRARMLPRRKALGYREIDLLTDTLIGAGGATCRGHEFHYSEISQMPNEIERCYRVSRLGVELGLEGYRISNCLASYIHLHFGSTPDIAPAFVSSCRNWRADILRQTANIKHPILATASVRPELVEG